MRHTYAKGSIMDSGLGSIECTPIWESAPSDEGSFVRVDEAPDGRLFVTITDMEMPHSSMMSVQISDSDFDWLRLSKTTRDEGTEE